SLLAESVGFARLGLAIVDEQHRFGVAQRAGLKQKGPAPHLLVMTATPIPRTLAMTVYGDLDVSVLDEMPPGRTPIQTDLVTERAREKVYDRVRKELNAGRQAYVVYPLVEESEKLDLKDATQMAEHLQRDVFRTHRVALLHGRMSHEDKDRVMRAFETGEVHVLVATTVVEVGVDVPNASIIVIEHAERFGLAQLHQLRGRVGRGQWPSRCILIGRWQRGSVAHERLVAIRDTTDGFRVAEEDLRLRGPGEILGTRQSGVPGFRVANLIRDAGVLAEAREAAFRLVGSDPTLGRGGHKALRDEIRRRWGAAFADLTIG
ncbi:MAG: DNA helicase RecG, partial [Myxococcales bacterium]|nr:DNA helicase RecG [Myxococcales bacterium]